MVLDWKAVGSWGSGLKTHTRKLSYVAAGSDIM